MEFCALEAIMKKKIKNNWPVILGIIEKDHGVSSAAIKAWIQPLNVADVTEDTIYFSLDNKMGSRGIDFLESKFYDMYIQLAINELFDTNYDIKFVIKEESNNKNEDKSNHEETNLNPKYTFDTFIIGDNNKFAHAASVAVAESPAEAYNPLFLYGGVGLGKTHLMQAIGHHILKSNKDFKVLYVTSEAFTNELIESIKQDKNQEFRDKYRNIDLLLIDDIQFIIGKESTQEEFFHTFNTLHQAKKQVVITSDKSPKDLERLEERLRTRFEMGIQADISSPNYETRMAILRKKVESDDITIDDNILDYIASNIKSNIRELEGALNKIMVFSNLERQPIDLLLAEKALKDLISQDGDGDITAELIIQNVAEHYGISMSDMISKKKSQYIAYPRHIAMYLCNKMTECSLQYIGNILGKRDHTTVMHGVRRIEDDIKDNQNTKNAIDVLIKKINPNI